MNELVAGYKGIQGRAWKVWRRSSGKYEVEMVWGGQGIILVTDTFDEADQFLTKQCLARRTTK